jgi:hypothetical protein
MENLFSLLRRDHARLKASAGPRLSPAGEADDGAVRRLARDWAIHFVSEENFLFPRLSAEAEVRPLLRRLAETHALMREDFREALSGGGEAKAESLRASLRRVVEMEEETLLRKAEEIIPPEEAEALARDVEEFREDLGLAFAAA